VVDRSWERAVVVTSLEVVVISLELAAVVTFVEVGEEIGLEPAAVESSREQAVGATSPEEVVRLPGQVEAGILLEAVESPPELVVVGISLKVEVRRQAPVEEETG
jgi:hypothetical protein